MVYGEPATTVKATAIIMLIQDNSRNEPDHLENKS